MATPTFRDFETILADLVAEGKDKMQAVTNWVVGGVMHSILAVAAKGLEKLYESLKQGVGMAFLNSPFGANGPRATGDYLTAKALELGLSKQSATKAQGRVIFYRSDTSVDRDIEAGKIVSINPNADGVKLRFKTKSLQTILTGASEIEVEVEAELPGAAWNVGSATIVNIETPIIGIDGVRNDQSGGWLDKEGDDEETEDALRERCAQRWAALTYGGTKEAYISFAKEVVGVELVEVHSLAPRGEGTTDVMITSTAPDGVPTAGLIADVQAIVDARKPVEADVLVRAPAPIPVDIIMTVYRGDTGGLAGEIQADVEDAVEGLFQPTAGQSGFGIGDSATLARLFAAAITVEHVANVVIDSPTEDVAVPYYGLASLNSLTVVVL